MPSPANQIVFEDYSKLLSPIHSEATRISVLYYGT